MTAGSSACRLDLMQRHRKYQSALHTEAAYSSKKTTLQDSWYSERSCGEVPSKPKLFDLSRFISPSMDADEDELGVPSLSSSPTMNSPLFSAEASLAMPAIGVISSKTPVCDLASIFQP